MTVLSIIAGVLAAVTYAFPFAPSEGIVKEVEKPCSGQD